MAGLLGTGRTRSVIFSAKRVIVLMIISNLFWFSTTSACILATVCSRWDTWSFSMAETKELGEDGHSDSEGGVQELERGKPGEPE